MFRKFLLIAVFTLLPVSLFWAQTTVFGYVKDEQGKPVENVEVDLKGSETVKTDKIGYFQIVDLPAGNYQMVIFISSHNPTFVAIFNDKGRKL